MLENKMYNDFEYKVENNRVKIIKYHGNDSRVRIPDYIDEFIVDTIGVEAFRDNLFIEDIILSENIHVLEKYAFCGCNGIKDFYFVDGIESIGAHCFYNCRKLRRIGLKGELKEIGDGAFKNCGNLQYIEVRTDTDKVYAIKYPLDSLLQDVLIHIQYRYNSSSQAQLYFPKDEVYYSYYTTRLNDKTTFGVGNNYHNCIANGVIDYKRYDNLFLGAKNFLSESVLIEIAMGRLLYPHELEEEQKEKYRDYLFTVIIRVCEKVINQEEDISLNYLMNENMLSKEVIEHMIEYATENNKVEITSKLILHKNKTYSKRDLSFDL